MKKIADKIKVIVKGEKNTFGTDPMEPWSVKANISEASLEQYLLSKGIDPKHLSPETKISHAKSSLFLKWKQDHKFEEVEIVNEDALLDLYLKSKGINPKLLPTDKKIAYAKSLQFLQWKKNHMHESIQEEVDKKDTVTFDIPLLIRVLELAREDIKSDMDLHRVVERLINIRDKGMLTMDDYNFIAQIKEEYDLTEGRMKDIVTDREEKSRLNAYERGGADAYYGRKYSNPHKEGSVEHQGYHQGYHGGEKGGKDYGTSKGKPLHSFREAKTIQGTALDRFREKAAERAKKHDQAEKEMKARHASGKEDMKGSIDRLEKALNKEESEFMKDVKKKVASNKSDKYSHYSKTDKEQGREVSSKLYGQMAQHQKKLSQEETEHKVGDSVTVDSKFFGKQKGKVTKVDGQSIHVQRDGKKFSEKYPHNSVVKEESEQIDELNYDTVKSLYDKRRDDYRGDKVGEKKKGKKVSAKNVGTSISRLTGFKPTQNKPEPKNEEVEQIDELKKSTVKSWLSQQDVVPTKKPGMDRKAFNKRIKTRSASWDRALDRMTGQKPTSEDVYQDSQAATQTNFDGANSPESCEPTTGYKKMKQAMSKSARIIKSLYNKKGVVKEELYDAEKEDKSVATYGKKPKVQQVVKGIGDNKPQAAAVLTGGKTLTGQTRDTLEIDPVMKKPTSSDSKKTETK